MSRHGGDDEGEEKQQSKHHMLQNDDDEQLSGVGTLLKVLHHFEDLVKPRALLQRHALCHLPCPNAYRVAEGLSTSVSVFRRYHQFIHGKHSEYDCDEEYGVHSQHSVPCSDAISILIRRSTVRCTYLPHVKPQLHQVCHQSTQGSQTPTPTEHHHVTMVPEYSEILCEKAFVRIQFNICLEQCTTTTAAAAAAGGSVIVVVVIM
mmetsp:Transcript_33865/g.65914  ORF Transcript_33865/g.65914 Transcript_33865/m.65914 type:complete len:205 (-) Transcript_33865:103-717(-)